MTLLLSARRQLRNSLKEITKNELLRLKNMSQKTKEIHLASRPSGVPKQDNFELVETEIPDIETGEILVRNEWLSVDPYMRGRMNDSKSYVEPFQIGEPMEGGCIGKVVASKHDEFSEGDYIQGNLGWREYWKSDGSGVQKIEVGADVEPSNYLGVLGMTGMTAYVGLMKIGELQDTVERCSSRPRLEPSVRLSAKLRKSRAARSLAAQAQQRRSPG